MTFVRKSESNAPVGWRLQQHPRAEPALENDVAHADKVDGNREPKIVLSVVGRRGTVAEGFRFGERNPELG